MPNLHSLTSGELSTTLTACRWLMKLDTINSTVLDPVIAAKISTLAADCAAETEDRANAEQDSRRKAVAARRDPMAHYTA